MLIFQKVKYIFHPFSETETESKSNNSFNLIQSSSTIENRDLTESSNLLPRKSTAQSLQNLEEAKEEEIEDHQQKNNQTNHLQQKKR